MQLRERSRIASSCLGIRHIRRLLTIAADGDFPAVLERLTRLVESRYTVPALEAIRLRRRATGNGSLGDDYRMRTSFRNGLGQRACVACGRARVVGVPCLRPAPRHGTDTGPHGLDHAPGGATSPRAPVKIALLLPLGGMGETAAIAKSMKQAAEMALFELNDPYVQLITKDDGGTAVGGRAAADAAIKEGAEIILGPLLSQDRRGRGAGGAQSQRADPRLLQRHAGGRQRRLPDELPRRGGGRPRRLVRQLARQAALRGAHSRQRLRQRGGAGLPPRRQAQRAERSSIVERYPPAANGMLGPAKRVVEAIKRADEL